MNRDAFRKLPPVVGVEDGSFQKGITTKALLTAVLFKDFLIEDVKIAKITVDGFDATETLTKILEGWIFGAVILAGVSFAGFNVIDPLVIYKKYGKPVIVVTRTKPDNKAVKTALRKHFADWETRFEVFEKLSLPFEKIVFADKTPIYIKVVGSNARWAKNLVSAFSILGKIPEPLRVARIIARGLS